MKFLYIFLFFLFLITSCATVQNRTEEKSLQNNTEGQNIKLLFAGDIMAHKPNFNMSNYEKIWDSIRDTVHSSDYAFANLEAPVCNNLPYSSFPNFNMHDEYPEAAISAGFNVFSIINNHSNDQGLDGIKSTLNWADKIEQQTASSNRPVYFSGLIENSSNHFSYRIIKKENWTILFCAITEILNRPTYKSYMNFVSPTEKAWKNFTQIISQLRTNNPCDIFVLSIHTEEPEYVFEIDEKRRHYYYSLLDNGVDVLWTNHPHVPREKEIIGNKATQRLEKVIIYGNGNVISGQRWEPDFENPSNPRDHTGDAYLMEINFSKSEFEGKPFINDYKTHFITTYINSNWEFIIKKLDDDFINYLAENGQPKWSKYMQERKKITEQTKETITWR